MTDFITFGALLFDLATRIGMWIVVFHFAVKFW